jgi:hypothetical protein
MYRTTFVGDGAPTYLSGAQERVGRPSVADGGDMGCIGHLPSGEAPVECR